MSTRSRQLQRPRRRSARRSEDRQPSLRKRRAWAFSAVILERGEDGLGPYETRYDVRRGYGDDRAVVRP